MKSAGLIILLITISALLIGGCRIVGVTHPGGPVWEAVQKTLALQIEPNPVKEDLTKRGLYIFHHEGQGSNEIHLGEIEKLVEEGVYIIDEEGYLQFGPSYTPQDILINVQEDIVNKIMMSLKEQGVPIKSIRIVNDDRWNPPIVVSFILQTSSENGRGTPEDAIYSAQAFHAGNLAMRRII